MKHPFTGNRNLFYYLLVWAVVAIAHVLYMIHTYPLSVLVALTDSLVFNTTICGLGLSYWYVVRFVNVSPQKSPSPLLTHAIGVLVIVLFAIFTAKGILQIIFAYDTYYTNLLAESMIWRAFLACLYLLNIILVYYLIRYYQNMQERLRIETQLQGMVKEAELDMLKSQINPHFIFNSLNSISSLTLTSPAKAQDMVIRLSQFLRYSLGKGGDEKNSLEEEMANILLYLEIEKVRFGDRLHVSTTLEEPCTDTLVPNMILQPIFENAIKYGVYETLGKVEITLKAHCEGDKVVISVSNNFDPNGAPRKGKGIGLKNVDERMRLVYGQGGLLKVNKQENIFTVSLTIPQKS